MLLDRHCRAGSDQLTSTRPSPRRQRWWPLPLSGCPARPLGGSVHDPTDPIGRLLFTVLSMIAEFEADLARSRTREGMAVATAKGRLRGKQPKLNAKQEAHLADLWHAGRYRMLATVRGRPALTARPTATVRARGAVRATAVRPPR